MHTTEFVKSYFDAWNQCDPKGVADHLAADGVYCNIPETTERSHDDVIFYLADFFAKYRHRYELIGDILKSRNTIAYQYKVSPSGNDPKTHSPNAYRGAEFMTLHGDSAIIITDYYDISGMGRPSTSSQLILRRSRTHKYAKSSLDRKKMLEYKDRLKRIMLSEKLFLKPDLTLPKLASAVDCSVNHLSQVINDGFGMSFFDYLNQYRIEHARELLSRRAGPVAAIFNIAFAAGFNSNSAFYAAFNKWVGQTPAKYRREQSKKLHKV
jgi:AraC-like DNA-binding protein